MVEQGPKSEQSPPREILVPIPDVITISGYSGVGKTSVAHILKAMLHMRFEKVGGEKFRAWYERTTGQKVLGFADRDPSVDRTLDNYTSSRITHTIKTGRKVIVEARLGGWLAKRVGDKQKQPGKTFRILLGANAGVRVFRIRERENKKRAEMGLPPLSLNQVDKMTKEREQKDLAIWRIAHPELRNIDPLSEINRDEHGESIYDLVINTDDLSTMQVADRIYRELQVKGLLMRMPEKAKFIKQQLPAEGTIFKAP